MASASRSATPLRRCAASRWSSFWTRGRNAGPQSRIASTLGAAPHTLPSLTTTRPHLCRLARVQRGERVRGRRHLERPRPRLHRVHAHQGGTRPLARVHALDPGKAKDSWHPHAPRALRTRPPTRTLTSSQMRVMRERWTTFIFSSYALPPCAG